MAHQFTLQAGVPQVTVLGSRCREGRSELTLSQGRFAIDESGQQGAQRWRAPLTLRTVSGGESREVAVSGAAAQRFAISGCGAVLANAGHKAYLRVRYMGAAQGAINEQFAALDPVDQLGVLDDTAAFALSGQAPLSDFVALPGKLSAAADPLIWNDVIGRLVTLDRLYNGLPTQDGFRRYARGLLQPLYARLGWQPVPGESGNAAILRAALLPALGRFADPVVMAAVHQRFAAYLQDAGTLSAAQRRAVLDVMAYTADESEWQQLRAMAKAAPSGLERLEIYRLLARARDPLLAQRALDLALTDEAPTTLRSQILSAAGAEHPEQVVHFMSSHWRAVEPLIAATSISELVPNAAATSVDIGIIPVLEDYAAQFLPTNGRSALQKNIARVRYNANLRGRLGQIDRWLARPTA